MHHLRPPMGSWSVGLLEILCPYCFIIPRSRCLVFFPSAGFSTGSLHFGWFGSRIKFRFFFGRLLGRSGSPTYSWPELFCPRGFGGQAIRRWLRASHDPDLAEGR